MIEIVERESERIASEHPAVTVDIEGPPQAWDYADETLSCVVRELLENAIEHRDQPLENCRITIAVDRSISAVTVEISGNGPGIPPHEFRALDSGRKPHLRTPLGSASSS